MIGVACFSTTDKNDWIIDDDSKTNDGHRSHLTDLLESYLRKTAQYGRHCSLEHTYELVHSQYLTMEIPAIEEAT